MYYQLLAPKENNTMPMYQRSIMDSEDDENILDEEIVVDKTLSKDEQTWQQRYADLRRHLAKKDLKIKEQDALLSSRAPVSAPSTDDENALNEWMNQYPDIARVVSLLADKRAETKLGDLDTRVKDFEERKRKDELDFAQKKLSEIHPDFFETIRLDPEFHDWLNDQSPDIQAALLSDEKATDWKGASLVINAYKAEKGLTKAPKRDNNKETVRDIPSRSTSRPQERSGQHTFTESQIKSMSYAEYDKREEEITEALRTGKVLMDLTGGAR